MTRIARLASLGLFPLLATILIAPVLGQDGAAVTRPPLNAATSAPVARSAVGQTASERMLASRPDEALRVLSSSARGVVLELAADSFGTLSAAEGVAVSASGCARLAEPGEPDLPSRVVFVGIPQTGSVRLSASTERTETSTGVVVRPAVGFGDGRPGTEDR
ncbi:hypothetical protein JXD38_12105, partial [candidate division WOR-3 bacterium]|nr:hypothetical protein [candidate division WOR-3 bacterium]